MSFSRRAGRLTLAYQHNHQDDVPRWDQVAQRGFARYAFDPQVRQMGYVRYDQAFRNRWARTLRVTASVQRSDERREYRRAASDVSTIERDEVVVSGLTMDVRSQPARWLAIVSAIDYYGDAVQSARRDVTGDGAVRDQRGLYPDDASAHSLAAFSQATVSRGRWILDGGLRVGRVDVSARDSTFGDARIDPVMATASGSAMFTVRPGLRVFGTLSQAFRAPNVDDLSSLGQFDFGVEVPSPHLTPERSVSVEGGLKLRTDRAGASLSVYRTSLERLIERVPGRSTASR